MVTTITQLEAQISKAQEAAGCFLKQYAEEYLTVWEHPARLMPRARELSAGFHAPLCSDFVARQPIAHVR
jgi:hypothetical protein